jgi:hypothetical protein
MPAFDVLVNQLVSRARLLERMLHDRGPWSAIVYAIETEYRVPLERTVMEDESRVALVAYIGSSPQLHMMEIYCGSDLVAVRELDGAEGPCRVLVESGVSSAEAIL